MFRPLVAVAALMLGQSVSPPFDPPIGVAADRRATPCEAGQALEVLWDGNWWPARARANSDAQGRCPIRYDGYGAEWDETVDPSRYRPAGGGSVQTTSQMSGQCGALYDGLTARVQNAQRAEDAQASRLAQGGTLTYEQGYRETDQSRARWDGVCNAAVDAYEAASSAGCTAEQRDFLLQAARQVVPDQHTACAQRLRGYGG